MRRLVLLMSILAACDSSGGDDAVTPDAKRTDATTGDGSTGDDNTSCANPIATTADGPITISGVTTDGSLTGQGGNLGGVTVSAFKLSGGAAQGSSTSEDPSGIYQVQANDGFPVDYVQLDLTGYVSTRFFPQAPIKLSQSLKKLPLFTASQLQGLASAGGASGNPVAILVADCTGATVTGATVTAPAGATIQYGNGGSSTDGTGLALIFGLPAGQAKIGASKGSTLYHAHTIIVDPSYFSMATISER